jgi:hypothetical protein
MRILLSCLQGRLDHSIPAYSFWRSYFVNGLREAGHEPIEAPGLDWAEGMIDENIERLRDWRSRTWQSLLDFARRENAREPIDLFLSYLSPLQVDYSAVAQLRHFGIPCVNFYCDNVREFRQIPDVFRCFDLHWVPEFEALLMYSKAGLPHVHAPMPCWIPPALRSAPERESSEIIFIGSADILRQALLGRAIERGANIEIYGRGWNTATVDPGRKHSKLVGHQKIINQVAFARRHGLMALGRKFTRSNSERPAEMPPAYAQKGELSEAEYFEKTRNATVTIGISRLPSVRSTSSSLLTYSRMRDIEAPMLGACYLTERTRGVCELYNVGVEIETYETAEELAAKIGDLSRDPSRRRIMRESAQNRALNEHCVGRSISKIAFALGLGHALRGD